MVWILGDSVHSLESDWIIPVDPFELAVFYDPVIQSILVLPSECILHMHYFRQFWRQLTFPICFAAGKWAKSLI